MTIEPAILDKNMIKDKIYTVRGQQVILDEDLADFYNVETRVVNQAVKRNSERFPDGFMFFLNKEEYPNLKSQSVISSEKTSTSGRDHSHGGRRKLPLEFTEQGVAMLSGVLRSDIAVKISIQIINAFVSMRRFIASNAQVF